MTRIPYLLVLLLALGVTSARVCHARDTARPVGPIHSWTAADLDRFDGQWLHVKFVEGSNVRLESGRLEDDRLDLSPVRAALARASALEIRPTFTWDRATVRAWKAAGEAKSGAVGPDLSLWFDVRIAAGKAELARAINELNALPQVEIAHPAPIVEPAALPAASATVAPAGLATRANAPRDLRTPDFTGQQGYLYAPPTGFDAAAAWALPGGKGAGQKFIDVELAWTEQHEDFDQAKLFHVGGAGQSTNPAYIDHGTAVLGEVIGMHNAYGVNGFAADTEWGVVAVLESEWPNVPHRFQEALDNLPEGGVWLIELQMYPPGHSATPMEYLQVNYDVIWTSVWARGVVCVEAGANGSQNLDDASWGGLFDRNVRDSGAIMVGAGTPNGLDAEWFTNYGTRMDVQGWGSSIVSTGYGDLYSGGGYETEYTAAFSGTSGASPMVVGSTLCLQGIFAALTGRPLTPLQLRSILHDTGTPQNGPRLIGPRPNLGPASAAVLALAAGVPEAGGASAPTFAGRAYPNPFHSQVAIRFDMPQAGAARVLFFDAAGRRVASLAPRSLSAGPQSVLWSGRDDAGRTLGSGIYFFRVETGDAGATPLTGRVQKIE